MILHLYRTGKLHFPPVPTHRGRNVRMYVEKIVAGKPLSLIGPFDSRDEAERFLRRLDQEERLVETHRNSSLVPEWFRDVRYRVLYEGEVQDWLR